MAFAGRGERPEFAVLAEAQTDAEKQQAEQRRRVAAVAAGGALVVGAGDGQTAIGSVPPAAARASVAAAILAALVAFLAAQRGRAREWLMEELRRRQPSVALDDVAALVAEEERLGQEFERRSLDRFSRGVASALTISDRAKREAAIRTLTDAEQRYSRQRDEAMAVRAFAAVDRVVLRSSSPQGAFWRLDPTVTEHTAGCLAMGGKFWPWAVLDRVHPPRHHGCPCRLLGYGEAIAEGLMAPGDVVDVKAAVRRAAHVLMEGSIELLPDDAAALLVEAYGDIETAQLRQASIAAGLTTAERFDAALP